MRKIRKSKKLNLARLFDQYPRMTNYENFIKKKVIPIIGERAVHETGTAGNKKYMVTGRNFTRVAKALDIKEDKGTEVILSAFKILLDNVIQPVSDEYPICYRIPLHPISHNALYKAVRGKFVRAPAYTNWRNRFFPLAVQIVSKSTKGVDFTKPLKVLYKFGHREKSDAGNKFDRPNFQKAAQDCIFEHFGSDDSMVLESSITGEFVESYEEGYIEFNIRNI